MNHHYEVKLQYDLTGWYNGRIEVTHRLRNWEYLVKAADPSQAIEEAKEDVRDNELGGWDEEEDVLWRVSYARRIPVPEGCLFFDDMAVVGEGWVSDGFMAVPEGRAVWVEKYLFDKQVRTVSFDSLLFSQLAPGENVTFSGYGYAVSGDQPLAVLQTVEGSPVYIQRQYYDFAVNQLAAVSWQRHPMTNRKNDSCVVAYDADGQAVAYVMPFTGKWVSE